LWQARKNTRTKRNAKLAEVLTMNLELIDANKYTISRTHLHQIFTIPLHPQTHTLLCHDEPCLP
jgi:hypothetical protein